MLPGGSKASGTGFTRCRSKPSPITQTSCSWRTIWPPVKPRMRVTNARSTSPRCTRLTNGVDSEQRSSTWMRGKAWRNKARMAGNR